MFISEPKLNIEPVSTRLFGFI